MSSNQPGLPSETLPQNEKMAVVRLWPTRVGRGWRAVNWKPSGPGAPARCYFGAS